MINIDDCWLYAGYKDTLGYGRIFYTVNGKTKYEYAHRVSYMTFIGDMADGLVTDHLCSVRHCINPDHLEAVTARENTLRGEGVKVNQRKTQCPKGHEYTIENTQYFGKKRWRRCRQCAIQRHRDYHRRQDTIRSIKIASNQKHHDKLHYASAGRWLPYHALKERDGDDPNGHYHSNHPIVRWRVHR